MRCDQRTGGIIRTTGILADGRRPERVFAYLQRAHAIIGLARWPAASPRPYMSHQSIILAADESAAQLVLDAPFPHDFVVVPGERVALRAALGGQRHLGFHTTVLGCTAANELLLEMPAEVDSVQRRRAPRLRCGNNMPALVEFGMANGSRYSALLEDVSADGMRISMTGPFAPELAVGSRVCEVSFELDGETLQCRARVQRWRTRDHQVEAGLALTGLERSAQRRLERLGGCSPRE